jgi:hypothetical protein
MGAREGDLLQTHDGLIFDVKGLAHPAERIVAFPRFVPDSSGDRKRKSVAYKKVYSISERYRLLEKWFPQYLVFDPIFGECLCEVPKEDVRVHYDPITRLQELRDSDRLDDLESDALRFSELLQKSAGVPWSKLGISGSLLAKLHTPRSDIDVIVYGRANCLKTYEALRSEMKSGEEGVRAYRLEELRVLYNFRSQDTRMPFESFIKSEHRKASQGKFLRHDYFIRCIVDWDEVGEKYGDIVYKEVGYAKIRAKVSDDSEAIFTPCRYTVEAVQVLSGEGGNAVTEVASFRGRFCEQALMGEVIVAQGKVEKVQRKNGEAFFRLLLGSKPSDFMALEG